MLSENSLLKSLVKKISALCIFSILLITTSAFADQSFSIGRAHGCAVDHGKVRCWGDNSKNQSSLPPELNDVVRVSAGWFHTCALSKSKVITCWGDDSTGQLTPPSDLQDTIEIYAGGMHTCALSDKGSVRCWGDNSKDQLNVPRDLGKVIKVSAGGMHTCAITQDKLGHCWGDNTKRQLNIDNQKLISIAAGYAHTCVIYEETIPDYGASRDIRFVNCVGLDDNGQAEPPSEKIGERTYSGVVHAATEIIAGYSHTCVVEYNRDTRCWGDIDLSNIRTTHIQSISSGAKNVCLRTDWGELKCFGNNQLGQSDPPKDFQKTKVISFIPFPLCLVTEFNELLCPGSKPPKDLGPVLSAVGSIHVCALTANHILRCFDPGPAFPRDLFSIDAKNIQQIGGAAYNPCLISPEGIASCYESYTGKPLKLGDLGPIVQIFSEDEGFCALQKDQQVRCGNQIKNIGPVKTLLGLSRRYFCALTVENKLECWNGWHDNTQFPVPRFNGQIDRIFGGFLNICAITTENEFACWGTSRDKPFLPPKNLGEIVDVYFHTDYACAKTLSGMRCFDSQGEKQILPNIY
jgi:hypothetical protein